MVRGQILKSERSQLMFTFWLKAINGFALPTVGLKKGTITVAIAVKNGKDTVRYGSDKVRYGKDTVRCGHGAVRYGYGTVRTR